MGGSPGPRPAFFQSDLDRLSATFRGAADTVTVLFGMDTDGTFPAEALTFSLSGGDVVRSWPVAVPRYLHGLVPLDDSRLLACGGLANGPDGLRAISAAEIADVGACQSIRLADMPFATAEPLAARLPDGRILVAGGYDDGMLVRACVLGAPGSTWRDAPSLPSPRAGATSVHLSPARILFAGGAESFEFEPHETALLLDAASLGFERIALALPADCAIVDLGGGAFLTAGGRDAKGDPIADVTLFSLAD